MLEYRIWDGWDGWSPWQKSDVEEHAEFSDAVACRILQRHRPDLRELDASDGASLTQTAGTGEPAGAGVAMVRHTRGVCCVEYRTRP
jgi:hypothetical protein